MLASKYSYSGKNTTEKLARLMSTVNKLSNKPVDQNKYEFVSETTYARDGVTILNTKELHQIRTTSIEKFESSLRIFTKNGTSKTVQKTSDGEYLVNSWINNIKITEKIRIIRKS